jgi:hypothetical protein
MNKRRQEPALALVLQIRHDRRQQLASHTAAEVLCKVLVRFLVARKPRVPVPLNKGANNARSPLFDFPEGPVCVTWDWEMALELLPRRTVTEKEHIYGDMWRVTSAIPVGTLVQVFRLAQWLDAFTRFGQAAAH